MLRESLKMMKSDNWRNTESFAESLHRTVVNGTDSRIPDGLVYHIADVYLEELDKIVDPQVRTEFVVQKLNFLIKFL